MIKLYREESEVNTTNNNFNTFTHINNEKDEDRSFEQYKLIIESINQINLTREFSNPFWSTVNGITVTGISYINNISNLTKMDKLSLTFFLLVIGYLFCLVWISYLNTVRKSLEIRYEILLELENNFPVKFFQRVYGTRDKKKGELSISFKQLLVPLIFVFAYTFFLVSLFISY